MIKTLTLIALLIVAVAFLDAGVVLAQSSPPGLPGSPDQVPMAGAALLAAAGIGYAAWRLKRR
jgi:hypothetical protein